MNNLPTVVMQQHPAGDRTRDLLIASPTRRELVLGCWMHVQIAEVKYSLELAHLVSYLPPTTLSLLSGLLSSDGKTPLTP